MDAFYELSVCPTEKGRHTCVVDRTFAWKYKHACAVSHLEALRIRKNSPAFTTLGLFISEL